MFTARQFMKTQRKAKNKVITPYMNKAEPFAYYGKAERKLLCQQSE